MTSLMSNGGVITKEDKKGLVYLFCGNGKGKTSAALGTALRSLLLGRRVVFVQWYKQSNWGQSEGKLGEVFPENLRMYWWGKGFFIKGSDSAKVNKATVFDFDTPEGHKKAAVEALNFTSEILTHGIPGWGMPELLVMDEVLNTISDGLLRAEQINKVVSSRGKANLVLTGRIEKPEVIREADLISKIEKIKHPFDRGVMAVRGLDF